MYRIVGSILRRGKPDIIAIASAWFMPPAVANELYFHDDDLGLPTTEKLREELFWRRRAAGLVGCSSDWVRVRLGRLEAELTRRAQLVGARSAGKSGR